MPSPESPEPDGAGDAEIPGHQGDTEASWAERVPEAFSAPDVAYGYELGDSRLELELLARSGVPRADAAEYQAIDVPAADGAEAQDPDELPGVVEVSGSTPGRLASPSAPEELKAFLDSLLADQELAQDHATEPAAEARTEPQTEPEGVRTVLDVALDLAVAEKEERQAGSTEGEEAPARGPLPAAPDERPREPAAPEAVPCHPDAGPTLDSETAAADGDSPALDAARPAASGVAEPGGEEGGELVEPGAAPEPVYAGDRQPVGSEEPAAPEEAASEEAIVDRARNLLATLDSTVSPAEPGSGRPGDLAQPDSRDDAGLVPAQNVPAVLRKILDPAADGGHPDGGHPREAPPVDPALLEALMTAVAAAVRDAGAGPIIDAVRIVAADPASLEVLRKIAGNPGPPADPARNGAGRGRLAGGGTSAVSGKLIVAALLLLAAGIAVPLLAGAAAEVILTNEVAIAALIVAVAALRQG